MTHKKRKQSLIKKFCSIVFSIVGIFLLIFIAFVFAYNFFTGENFNKDGIVSDAQNKTENDKGNFITGMLLPPKKTKFLVLGLDQNECLSDSILVGCFDRDLKKINIISIPRDTYIKMSQETIKELRKLGKHPPSSGIMKINAVHSYAGKEHGAIYAKKQIEELLNIKLDYYVAVNIKAFRKIVDAVGGIYMEIPKGGLYYNDPYQNLSIRVPEGKQLIDGKMAEGVVRFRATYKRGDLQRIEMQQQFMKEFFKQVLNKETIMKNLYSLIKTFLEEVKTDFKLTELPKYIKYVSKFDSESIEFYTLPGVPKMINGISYFLNDKKESAELIDKIFYSNSEKNKNAETYKIQILNGSNIDGLAKEKKDLLEKNNFKVLDIGNYQGNKIYETRIMVKEKDMGQDLKKYFNNVKIEVDKEIPEDYNVIIITGLGEKK